MGHEVAIMFSSLISHVDFLQSFHKDSMKSAGFFMVEAKPSPKDSGDIDVCVFGKSTTLKKGIRKGDKELLQKVLRNNGL